MKKTLKKLLAALLTAVIAVNLFSFTASAAESKFTDVKPSAWYAAAVDYVVENGLFSGTGNGKFSPNLGMTRAMFVTVLGRKSNVDTDLYTSSSFTDVAVGEWYSAYVEWAAENGIVSGTGGGKFSPNAQITREQMAAILYRYAKLTRNEENYRDEDDFRYLGFYDRNTVSAYADEAVGWVGTTGAMTGVKHKKGWYYDDYFEPRKTATRAEVAQVFMNCDEILVNTEIKGLRPSYGVDYLANGKPTTEENVQEMLYSLQETYPEGMAWGDSNGQNCSTFARTVWNYITGDTSVFGACDIVRTNGIFSELRVGDKVSMDNNMGDTHAVIVLEKHEDYIVVLEGNYNGYVHWGRKITRETLEGDNRFMTTTFYPVF